MFANRDALASSPAHDLALDCIRAGIEAAHPDAVVSDAIDVEGDRLRVGPEHVDLSAVDRLLVAGGGNAAGRLGAALETALGDRIDDGVVVTDDPAPCDRITVLPGDHPVPGERNLDHTAELLDLVRGARAKDLVLAPITGGGSALLTAPVEGVSLSALQETTDALLRSGAAIDEINAVRKHLSTIKGGRLAGLAGPASVVGLAISDVVGDDPATVASGPTAPDPTSYADALAVLDRYDVTVPAPVRGHLEAGERGDHPETPGPDDPAFERVDNHVIADGLTALQAATEPAREAGYAPLILSARIRGEARVAATTHVAIAEECHASGHPVSPPAVFLSGGETTVRRSGDGGGVGGPNHEFALSGALEVASGTVLASVDTDGIDGSTTAAGALVDHRTVDDERGARDALSGHDSHPFLRERNATIETGPTGTNVNDLRVVVVD